MDQPMTQLIRNRTRLFTALLVGSLALNALLVGYLGVLAVRRFDPLSASMPPRLIKLVKQRLPADDQKLLEEAYQSRHGRFIAAQAEYERTLAGAVALLAKPEFDEAAFRAAVADSRAKRLQIADLVLETFVDTIARMSPAGRRDLIGRFRPR
jgi:uncharacterized membrane protein